jgi:hypothetical protein
MSKSTTPPAWAVRRSESEGAAGEWRHVRAYGGEVDLAGAYRAEEGVAAELFTLVNSSAAGAAEIEVECDSRLRVPVERGAGPGGVVGIEVECEGGVEARLGGRPVELSGDGPRHTGRMELAAGANELLLRVGTDQGARRVSCRLSPGEGLSFSCRRPPGVKDPDRISGVFLYWGERHARGGREGWEKRFEFLRGLGMDTLIVQFSVVEGTAFYPSEHFERAVAEGDPTGDMLKAAAATDFLVHLGLASDEKHWWKIPYQPEDLPAYVEEEPARNNIITRELVERYRDEPALAGIYLSHEIHLGDEWGGDNMPHLVEIFNRMSDESKRLAPELAVSTAPFFSLRGTVEQYENRWRRFLEQTRLDILMLQDGVGCERNITVDNMVPYYETLARACDQTGVEFWTDLELFDLQRPETVTPERIRTQLVREAPHVTKVVAYSLANVKEDSAASLLGVGGGR